MVAWQALAQEPIPAVYKAHELSFHYRSSSYSYPCHELQQRVATLLQAVGARDDIDVDVLDCDPSPGTEGRSVSERDRRDPWDRARDNRFPEFGGPDTGRGQAARIRVRLMFPVAVTPEVLAEIERDKSRRELVSRVTRNPAAAFNDPIVFAARRQEVTLSRQSIRVKPEDCNLLDQLNAQVFRKLQVRATSRRLDCNPRMFSHIPPQLTVETLLPTGALLPMPAPENKNVPAGSSDNPAPQENQPRVP